MSDNETSITAKHYWRLIVIGGHTRSIGKTQLVCDVIRAFPEQDWIAGKITQYGHGVCAKNGANCGCAPDEHSYAIDWEKSGGSGTDSSRFLDAGAKRSFWLRTKQGFLAEGLPLLRELLRGNTEADKYESPILIIESNSLLQFVQPSLYFAVIDSSREDFKESARKMLDRADALVLHDGANGLTNPDASGENLLPSARWLKLPARLLQEIPSVRQAEREPLPLPLQVLVRRALESPAEVAL